MADVTHWSALAGVTLVAVAYRRKSFTSAAASLRRCVRIASTGHRGGTARLWFNDSAADSRFGVTISGSSITYYAVMTSGANKLNAGSSGGGPKKTVDVFVDRAVGGNPFKAFGAWTATIP